jgi:hypothetical protein
VAVAGGDSGMRRLAAVVDVAPPDRVVVVVVVLVVLVVADDGMLARTVDRTALGDTPRVTAGAQALRDTQVAAAIAPTRVREGEIIPPAKADSAPSASHAPTER